MKIKLRPYIPIALFFILGTAFVLLCMLSALSMIAPRLVDFAPILEHANEVIAGVLVLHLAAYVIKKCVDG